MKKYLSALIVLISISSYAQSGVIGAPQIVAKCKDSKMRVSVQILKISTDHYQAPQMAVTDITECMSQAIYLGEALFSQSPLPGSAQVYTSNQYRLEVNVGSAPTFNAAAIHFQASIFHPISALLPESPTALSCELI